MLQVAWRTWGSTEPVTCSTHEPQVLLMPELVQPPARAGHKSPFEVTFLLPYRGAVIAPSCPRTAWPRSQLCREADVVSRARWARLACGDTPLWWPPCVEGTDQHCSSCKSRFPDWPWGSGPHCSPRPAGPVLVSGQVLLTQCIPSGRVSVALPGRVLPRSLWPRGTRRLSKSQPCHCQLQLWLLMARMLVLPWASPAAAAAPLQDWSCEKGKPSHHPTRAASAAWLCCGRWGSSTELLPSSGRQCGPQRWAGAPLVLVQPLPTTAGHGGAPPAQGPYGCSDPSPCPDPCPRRGIRGRWPSQAGSSA